MNLNIRYPSISFGDPEEQLRDIRSYLYQLTDTLNACDTSALAVMNEISEAINAGSYDGGSTAPANETERRMREYASLRDLIIKTADYAAGQSESIDFSMAGKYVAISDFGTYFENATVDIQGTPYNITQIYNYAAGVDAENSDYRVTQESYIKSGLLYYDSGTPVYGVGVGNIYGNVSVYEKTTDTVVNHAKTYYERTGTAPDYTYTPVEEPDPDDLSDYYERVMSRTANQIYSTFTADEIAFWSGSTKLAYMNSGAVYFPDARITGGSIAIGGTTQNPTFYVDTNGNLTASNANLSGTINASLGSIGGWTIGETSLYAGASSSYVGLNSTTDTTKANYSYAFWAGAESPSSASFFVKKNGDIKATSGLIGAWKIDGNSLYTTNSSGTQGSIYLNGRTGTIYGAHISSGDISIGSGTFEVDSAGHVDAESITLYDSGLNSVKLVGGSMALYASVQDLMPEGFIGIASGSAGSGYTSGIGIFGMAAEVVATSGGAALKTGSLSSSNGYKEASVYTDGAHIYYSKTNGNTAEVEVTKSGYIHLRGLVHISSANYGSASGRPSNPTTGQIYFQTA